GDALAPANLETVDGERSGIDERQIHIGDAVEEHAIAAFAQMLEHVEIDSDVRKDIDELKLEGDGPAHLRGDAVVELGELAAEHRGCVEVDAQPRIFAGRAGRLQEGRQLSVEGLGNVLKQ